MHRKKLLMVILMSAILLLTACGRGDVDLSFIDMPKKVSLMSGMYHDEIKSLNEEWKKGQNINDKESQQKLLNKMIEYYKAATLEIEDEEFIKTVFNAIKKEKASVWESNRIGPVDAYCFKLNINDESQIITDEYLDSVSIFEDGSAFLIIQNHYKSRVLKSIALKINLKTDDFEYIQKYFDDHKSK